MADRSNRPSPSESATMYVLGEKKVGNDGNTWVVKQTPKGVKRWVRDTNAVPISAPTNNKSQNYFLLKNGVQITEEGKGASRFLEFVLDKTKIRQDEVANLVEDIKYTDGVNHAVYKDNVNTYTITINTFATISTMQEDILFENIETILDGLGYGNGVSKTTQANTYKVPSKNIQDPNGLILYKGDVFYYYDDINSPRFITDIDTINDVVRYTRVNNFNQPSYEMVDFNILIEDINKGKAFYLRVDEGGNFYNEDDSTYIEVSNKNSKGGYDLQITEKGDTRKGGVDSTENLNMLLVMNKFRPVESNTQMTTGFDTNALEQYDLISKVADGTLYFIEKIYSNNTINFKDTDKIDLVSADPIEVGKMVTYPLTIKEVRDLIDSKQFEYIGRLEVGDTFANSKSSVKVDKIDGDIYYTHIYLSTSNKSTDKENLEGFIKSIVQDKYKKVSAVPSTAPKKKIELNIADIVAQTKFSQGLKDDLIKDFKSSGYEDVWLLIGNDIATTSQNIQKNIIGFPSGKNTYLQADKLAEIMIAENQKLRSANKPSALTNVEPILAIGILAFEGRIYVYGVDSRDTQNEAKSIYSCNFSKKGGVIPIIRQGFFIKGDVISYEDGGYKYESLVKDIREESGTFVVELENTYSKDIYTFDWAEFSGVEDVRVIQYYNLWELFDNPVLVAKPEDVKEKSQVDKDLEDEIKSLNKQISDLVFLRSLLLPIDFEKKIELGQRIAEKQKTLNELNFKLVERRLGSKDIFDELFEQSFVEIKHTYTDTKGDADTDYFAPNGQKSELSDELSIMIRTPQFKEWFGDWEMAYLYKDTDVKIPCSKVVNANYEPMVVWHGTGAEFSYFRFDKFPATYFAKKKAYSDWFADMQGGGDGYTIPFFLDIKNPLDLRHFGTRKVTSKEFFDFIFLKTGLDMDMLEVNPIFMSNSFPPNETWVYLRNNAKMLKKLSESKMNDGIMFFETNPSVPLGEEAHETEAYIIFNANQSKIASTDRGMLLLSSLKSFLLKRGGQI